MRLEHHLVGGYVRYISPLYYYIIIITTCIYTRPHVYYIYVQNDEYEIADEIN